MSDNKPAPGLFGLGWLPWAICPDDATIFEIANTLVAKHGRALSVLYGTAGMVSVVAIFLSADTLEKRPPSGVTTKPR
jgi:hypothetical protein